MTSSSRKSPGSPPATPSDSADSAGATVSKYKIDHWNSPVTGHGIACLREMIVEFRTLQWVNPHAAAASAARKRAREKSGLLREAREALKKPSAPGGAGDSSTMEKLAADAEAAARAAEEEAVLLERKQAVAEAAHIEAGNIAREIVCRHERSAATWIDLLEFESALLRLLDGEKLRARYQSLAVEFKGLKGSDAPDMPMEEATLRARAESLLAEIHWAYTTAPIQEKQRSRMTFSLIAVTVAVAVATRFFPGTVLGWVGLSGALGAALSAFQRVQSRDMKADAMTNCEKDFDGRAWWQHPFSWLWNNVCSHNSFALAPAIGALSALVLAHLFAADIINGPAFPKITTASLESGATSTNTPVTPQIPAPIKLSGTNKLGAPQPGVKDERPDISKTTPPNSAPVDPAKPEITSASPSGNLALPTNFPPADASKKSPASKESEPVGCDNDWKRLGCSQLALLLVWGFLAGFSERLVPDMLTRFTQKAKT